jgi:solute carrier family 30 (zinc transporter), member 5/7
VGSKDFVAHSPFIQACALTTMTLLIVGVLAKVRISERVLDRRKYDDGKQHTPTFGPDILRPAAVQSAVLRALSIGLPLYSAMQLGGVRTALILLLAISSGISEWRQRAREQSHIKNAISGAQVRKFAAAALLVIVGSDLLGLTAYRLSVYQLILGYLALAVSIFALPLPLPSAKRYAGFSTASSGKRSAMPASPTPPATPMLLPSSIIASPLLYSTDNVNLTLFAGIISLAVTALTSIFTHTALPISSSSILFSTATSVASASLFFFSQPILLNTHGKFGVLAGCALAALFGCTYHSSSIMIPMMYSIWSGLAYVAALLDGLSASKRAANRFKDDDDYQAPSGEHSRFTSLLLRMVTEGSILHDVLSEKDSRRIAYFAR